MKAWIRVGLATLVVALAGCTGPAGAPQRVSMTNPSTQPEEPLEFIAWENCTGVAALIEVSRAAATAAVPPDFVPQGKTGQTASLLLDAVDCPRVVVGNRVLQGEGYVRVAARVDPVNESMAPNQQFLFVLDAWVTSNDLREAVAELGQATKVASLSRVNVSQAGLVAVESWTFDSGDGRVEFEYAAKGQPGIALAAKQVFWTGSMGHYLNIDAHSAYRYDSIPIEPGVVRVPASSTVATLMPGNCCLPWLAQNLQDYSALWNRNVTFAHS